MCVHQGSHSDWKNRKAFSSQGKSIKILENSGNFRKIVFIIFSDIYMNWVLFAKMDQVSTKQYKNTEKMGKDTGKVRREFCQSRKVGTMYMLEGHLPLSE